MVKKTLMLLAFLGVLGFTYPAFSYAQEATPSTCTTVTQYGGAVSYICGAETHVPVNTGFGDNLPLYGFMTLGASALLFYLSRKAKKVQSNEQI